ncbi:tRNA (adenosine(37)-N6)-threonylcarbamoyltransferase complex dimerization subunit type 1 TsaB [Prosthecomicrobium hirschii]|uniref:tRNA (adenosine(37)-N6)-threonylcarbamoyltransferase complex dimerization subunit type 1 TsaB n=1 Tax=Prosthecodimorpha hirschii TaxID=665126 RepID=UPI00221E9506|nr:tRNA (adenosine(37)-N6)-threonylcarbamoyltransferase complex dimerization subunit type 1 TsaB [Prosthecomicrobium hirschii]MCW1841531.1 tRNA (adenosine(37)-N6)-threonylcarbamoyltransferase complex dimerization subunit type 1 TsaB [Prosthecomicrobium hirschii]
MFILALDTALDACSVALLTAGGDVLARATRDIGRGHAEVLMAVAGEVFEAAGTTPRDLSRIVVTIGPGSFTGIRVGLAAARAIGLAADVPVVGVTTLEAIADEALAQAMDPALVAPALVAPVLVAIDARRGEVYAGLYAASPACHRIPTERTAPAAMSHAQAAALAVAAGARVVGSGALLVAAAAGGRIAADAAIRFPDIVRVGRIGAARAPSARPPAPVYLRAADAKPQEGFRIARTTAPDADPVPPSPTDPEVRP